MSDGGAHPWAIGVEEEYLLFAPDGGLRQASAEVRATMRRRHGEEVDPELLASQVEVATGIHDTIDGAGEELAGLRARVGDAARIAGARLGSVGCHPTARWSDQQVTDKERYHHLATGMAQVARETVVCGLHVHVGIADPEARIRAVNGVRPWLGPILALSASSPFWQGDDTGFASYRTPVFRRWPNTGVPSAFTDWADFTELVDGLAAAGLVDDGTNLYWDLRPSVRYPTVEVRIADACPRLDDALVVAALIRAVVRTVADPTTPPDGPPGTVTEARQELLEAAVRHAARSGLGGELVHPGTARPAAAAEVVTALVAWCRPALEAAGDAARVDEGIEAILATGGSAARLRSAHATGGWDAVTELIVTETAGGQTTPTSE